MTKSSGHTDRNEQMRTICYHVGSCILTWARVEHTLCLIFQAAMRSAVPPYNAYAIWDSVISLEARMSLLATVLGQALPNSELLTIWGNLAGRVIKRYKKRHQIAHGSIMGIHGEMVFVPYGTFSNILAVPPRTLSQQDLVAREKSFEDLVRAGFWFRGALVERLENAEAVLPPMGDLESLLRKQGVQNHADIQPPPES